MIGIENLDAEASISSEFNELKGKIGLFNFSSNV